MISGIHLLRAVASFLVLFYHVYYVSHVYVIGHVNLFEYFYVGVDIFFVVSGFIMYYVTHIGIIKKSLIGYRGGFFVDRFFRIIPLYWFFSVSFFIVNNIIYPAGTSKFLSLDKLIKSMLFIPYLDGQLVSPPVLGVGWTLNYEVIFYVVISISLYFFKNVFFSVAMIFVGLFCLGNTFQADSVYMLHLSNPIILEFLIGLLIGYVYVHHRNKIILLSVICGLIPLVVYVFDIACMNYHRLIVVGFLSGASVSVSLFASDRGFLNFAVDNKFLYFLGSSSYIMYLSHHPIVSLLGKLFNRYDWFGSLFSFYIVSFVVVYTVSFGLEYTYNNYAVRRVRGM